MIHGHTWKGGASPEYRTWTSMKSRCHNPSAPNYYKYGGRGITVCEQWRNSFAAFLSDMGTRPAGTTIDRIDGSIGYVPGNCRWATASEQNSNRSCSRMVTIGGETHTITEWARRAGVSDTCMLYRVRRGLSGEALLRKSHHGKSL